MVPFDRLCMVSYYCSIVTCTYISRGSKKVFEMFEIKKCRDLENGDKGPRRSLNMSSFDRAHI